MSDNMHLDIDKRKIIELELGKNTTFAEISKIIKKDPTTISKEIRKHRIKINARQLSLDENKCARRFFCHRKNVCNIQNAEKNVEPATSATQHVKTLLIQHA